MDGPMKATETSANQRTVSIFSLKLRQGGKKGNNFLKGGEGNGPGKWEIGVSNWNHGERGPDGPMRIVYSQNLTAPRKGERDGMPRL
jgi:hypothetical protein